VDNVSAEYVFPIPARAAVCAFEMKTQDGREVHGVVKEKVQAKRDYDNAVARGKWAGLLSEASKDGRRLSSRYMYYFVHRNSQCSLFRSALFPLIKILLSA
jgi:hypothetical protein